MLKNVLLIFLITFCLLAPLFGIMAILTAVIINRIIAHSAKTDLPDSDRAEPGNSFTNENEASI